MPEYKNVEVSFTHRKGGRVYLTGHVANKDTHDRLLQAYSSMVRNNDSGYYDGVEYPGKAADSDVSSKKLTQGRTKPRTGAAKSDGFEMDNFSSPPGCGNRSLQSRTGEDPWIDYSP